VEAKVIHSQGLKNEPKEEKMALKS